MTRKLIPQGLAGLFCFAGLMVQAQVPNPVRAQVTAGVAQPSSVLQLDDAVREALRNNPALQSALHAAQAQRRRVPQARGFTDPTVSIGWMGNITPFSVQTNDPSSY